MAPVVPADLDSVKRLAPGAGYLAVVATTRPDGTVHASVVSAGVLDDPVTGRPAVGMVVGGNTRKLGHLRRAGRATAVFRDGWQWVAVEGPVRIVGPDDPADGIAPDQVPAMLRQIFVAAGGTHDDWADYDRVMAEERRAAVFVEPARITGI